MIRGTITWLDLADPADTCEALESAADAATSTKKRLLQGLDELMEHRGEAATDASDPRGAGEPRWSGEVRDFGDGVGGDVPAAEGWGAPDAGAAGREAALAAGAGDRRVVRRTVGQDAQGPCLGGRAAFLKRDDARMRGCFRSFAHYGMANSKNPEGLASY